MSDEAVDVGVQEPSPPVYLGDGLYVRFDGYQVELYAHDGESRKNSVYLEPQVLQAFLSWLGRGKK